MLELDHVFFMVTHPAAAADRLEDDGWVLDDGRACRGQVDPDHSEGYRLYDALTFAIHVHRDNERFPERPMVFVLEAGEEEMRRRRSRASEPVADAHAGELREVRVRAPSALSLPPFAGPPVVHEDGLHALELVVGDAGVAHPISDGLVVRRRRRARPR